MDDLIKEFDHQIAGLAWSLWKELGVAGIDRFHENCLVLPEELIIMTAIISAHDPRLRDEALDWCSRYHESISVTRLRALLKAVPPDVIHAFSRFVSALNSVSSAKWPGGEENVHFKVNVSGKSILPSLQLPSLLCLRLRSLFGPGVKSDVLTHLLLRNRMHFSAAELVEIGYSKRSLMTALDHLAAAGIISVKNAGNKKNYELKDPKELMVVIGRMLPKLAPAWNRILNVIVAIRSIIPEIIKSSEKNRDVIFRNCLIGIKPLLPGFISPILEKKADFREDWNAVIAIFNAFGHGNFSREFEVENEFEELVIDLMPSLYQLQDSMDGISMILTVSREEFSRHGEIYKECYQLFLSFIQDLDARLHQFKQFPFHKMMDGQISEITYEFFTEKFPNLSEVKSLDKIENPQSAIRQYHLFWTKLDVVEQFLYSFKRRFEDVYFNHTNIHLLTSLDHLSKRHLVLQLFSP